MGVRCLRCGDQMEGLGQVCDRCAEERRQRQESQFEQAVANTTTVCPSCSATIPRASELCGECGYDFDPLAHKPRELQHVGFGLRLLAWVIDIVIVLVAQAVMALTIADQTLASVFGLIFGIVYLITFWSLEAATPGKMLLGLRILSVDGEPIGLGRSLLRYVGYIVCGFTFGVGYLMIIFNDDKRGLHDLIASTIVVHTETIPLVGEEPQAAT
jgi:uncharacterized RDD family membrane protein YckC